ncbi:hypothetical protein [Ramlibacter sp. PS4R-6]|uniref:hypothetical protein n=1 Tax=Ramlibacter sp. PS4R-6 TaxID=3133438 RepID=UPI00309547C2
MSVPVMRMGLVGFADERQLRNLLKTRNLNLQWERWPFMEADALWINGENAQPQRGNMVRIPSAEPGKPATLMNLKEMDRPTAFTLPFNNGYFTPPLAFDPHKVDQVADVFNQFEAQLLDTAVDLTLASAIADRRHDLASPYYHLNAHGKLVAIVGVTGDLGFAPDATPHEVAEADWAARPPAASTVPSHFRRTTIAHVMWNYVMRNGGELLPSRYRTATIYWRRMPNVPQRMVREEHLLLISALSTGPHTIESLVATTGLSEAAVSQALAALYFGGSLTTDPAKAGPARPAKGAAAQEDWPSSMTSTFQPPTTPAPSRPRRPQFDMPTVPQPLEPGSKH